MLHHSQVAGGWQDALRATVAAQATELALATAQSAAIGGLCHAKKGPSLLGRLKGAACAALQQFAIGLGLKALASAAKGAWEASVPTAVETAQNVGTGLALDVARDMLVGGAPR